MRAAVLQRQAHKLKLAARRTYDEDVGATIRKRIEELYQLPRGQLRQPGRNARLAYIRALSMWLFRHGLNWSLPRVGREFRRDHSTVFFAVNKVELWLAEAKPEVLHDVLCLQGILHRATQKAAMPENTELLPPAVCAFCGRGEHEVKNIVRSGDPERPMAICQDCVLTALQGILQQEGS